MLESGAVGPQPWIIVRCAQKRGKKKPGRRLRGCPVLQFANAKSLDRLFQLFRGAEGDLLARLDLDGFAGGRVAAHAGGALAHDEDAKTVEADTRALLQVL